MSERIFERLERVKYLRVEYHPAGETLDEMAQAIEWVRSKGHEATSLEAGGFRYRSVYPNDEYGRATSAWKWIEPGEWLVLMEGDGQDSEFDDPHAEGPDDGPNVYPRDDWHEITTTKEQA